MLADPRQNQDKQVCGRRIRASGNSRSFSYRCDSPFQIRRAARYIHPPGYKASRGKHTVCSFLRQIRKEAMHLDGDNVPALATELRFRYELAQDLPQEYEPALFDPAPSIPMNSPLDASNGATGFRTEYWDQHALAGRSWLVKHFIFFLRFPSWVQRIAIFFNPVIRKRCGWLRRTCVRSKCHPVYFSD